MEYVYIVNNDIKIAGQYTCLLILVVVVVVQYLYYYIIILFTSYYFYYIVCCIILPSILFIYMKMNYFLLCK